MTTQILVFTLVPGSLLLLEILARRARWRGVSANDWAIDLLSFAQGWVVTGPLVALGTAAIERHLLPAHANQFASLPLLAQFVVFLFAEDMVQYWYHRTAHRFPRLWPLHRAHHSAPYMGVRMLYRNSLVYALLMPNVWIAGVLVYLGLGRGYLAFYVLKAVVTTAAHSELRWDGILYRHRALAPLAWLLERTISLPATHFAHHASEDDPVGNPRGNYGNLLFFWDVLFGTALVMRRYPVRFGIAADAGGNAPAWYRQLLYPLFAERPPARDAAPAPSSAVMTHAQAFVPRGAARS
jgi:sterol desaturase/sphingolipid hydroxylase (fatty acid hydroxylase superfamily)